MTSSLQIVQGPFCSGCVQQPVGQRRIDPDGTGSNKVMFIGDSPWLNEIASGIPFAGPSGYYLNSILQRRQLARADFTVANIMNCKPPHLGWTDHPERFPDAALAAAQCKSYLDNLIAARKPLALVALGGVALSKLTGLPGGIEANQGYVCETSYRIPAIPTFHPSHIIQGAHKLTLSFVLAIERALEIADGRYKPTLYKLLEDPSLEQFRAYLHGAANYAAVPGAAPIVERAPFLMCDIETPESSTLDEELAEDDASYNIIRIGFSNSAGTSCSVPYEGAYIQAAKAAVRAAPLLLFFNKNYDLPRLLANGFELHPDVKIIDVMWMWHFLQSDLPKALAFVAPFFYSGPPWKHLARQRPAYYNAMDAAVQTSCYLGIKADLIREGRWERFYRHGVKCDPILVKMGRKGVGVDLEERNKFQAVLEKERAAEKIKVQELLPPNLVKHKVWVRQPKDMNGVTIIQVPATRKDGSPVMAQSGLQLTKPNWTRKVEFNPGSWQQILALMDELHIKRPRKRGEDRDTTEAKYLKRFAKKYEIFSHIVGYKERDKLIGTYMWPLSPETKDDIIWVEVQVAERTMGAPITGTESSYWQKGQEVSASLAAAKRQTSLQKVLEEVVCPPQTGRGDWVGEAPTSEVLQHVWDFSQDATHPSLGLGQVKQCGRELVSSLQFMPHEVAQSQRSALPESALEKFYLPVRAKITSLRAKTLYGFHPSTWRLSSRKVNLQNIPKRSDLAKQFRKMLIASPGHVLIEADWSALEAVLVGYSAGSESYIKLAKAGIHGWLASHVLHQPINWQLPFEQLQKLCKGIKKANPVIYEACKRVIHGSNYLLSAYGIYDEYEELFSSQAEANKLQKLYFDLPPGQEIRKWQERQIAKAHMENHQLRNHFDCVHYFYELYKYDSKSKTSKPGEDAKRAVAFVPQSDGAFMQRELMLDIDSKHPWLTELLCLPTHDSIVAECRPQEADSVANVLRALMTKKWPELGGLDIGVEIKVGLNLQDQEELYEQQPTSRTP